MMAVMPSEGPASSSAGAWLPTDPASGFSMDLSARKLIAHDDDDFEENGLAASFIFDPRPDSDRGLSVSLRQDSGEATGGVDALFMPQALERQEGGGASHHRRGCLRAAGPGRPLHHRPACQAAHG